MTPLRQQMIREMDLKNLSPHTRRSYLNAVTGGGIVVSGTAAII